MAPHLATVVHPNQKDCGKRIVRAFEAKHLHVLLLAQMQMGKSGTYWYTIFNMLFGRNGCGVKRVMLISGNRETELLEQVRQDKQEYTEWFLNQAHVRERSSPEDIQRMRDIIRRRIQIVWGQKLDKHAEEIQPNTLIVWDESHFAQSKENKPYAFLVRNRLEHLLNGSTAMNETRNIRILTVSATPFSELVSGADKPEFRVERLEPGANYYGVGHYLRKKLIHEAFQVSAGTREQLREVLLRHAKPDKYMIVRVANNRSASAVVRELCSELDLDVKHYNCRRRDISIRDLEEAPEKATVVLISGMLRMGKVVPKTHLSMVFESSTKDDKRHSDTSLQGLLGRVCGYTSDPEGFGISVYIEGNMLQHVETYVDTYDSIQGPITWGNAMNVRPAPPEKRSLKPYHVIPLSPEEGAKPLLTKMGNVRKALTLQRIRGMLEAAKDSLPGTPEERLKSLIDRQDTEYHVRNAEKDTNSWVRKLIDTCQAEGEKKATSYKTIDSHEVCLTSHPQHSECVWVVFRSLVDDKHYATKQEGVDHRGGLYVLDKCVFKPKTQV